MQHFNEAQLGALVSLSEDRLLLETDAPYFPRAREHFSAPNQLFDVAEMIALHRKVSVQHVLEVTKCNALRLYTQQ